MARIKRYDSETGAWEYCNTGTMPIKGLDYLTKSDYDQMKSDIDSYVNSQKETLEITLVGNQTTSSSDLTGALVKVVQSDGTEISRGVWDGTSLVFYINPGTEYYVMVDASGQGYSNFTSTTFTAVVGSRILEADVYAEKLTVSVSGLDSGFTITISGAGTQTDTSGSYLIPYGNEYTVSASKVTGYITPASVTYTANSDSRTVTMTYEEVQGIENPTPGVYIRATDGLYYVEDGWDSSLTPDCIAVITDAHSFGIALVRTSDMCNTDRLSYYDAFDNPSYLTPISSESDAMNDYDGGLNTENIIKASGDYEGRIAKYCKAYVFPSGCNGYQPAVGELLIAYNNLDAINLCGTRLGLDYVLNVSGAPSKYPMSSTYYGYEDVATGAGPNYGELFYALAFNYTDDTYNGLYTPEEDISIYKDTVPFCSLNL